MGRKDTDREKPEDEFEHEDPVVDEALEWFARLRNATPDAETRDEFERWLATSPRHVREYRDLEAMWRGPAFARAVDSLRIAAGVRHRARSRSARWATRAASVAAALLIAVGVWQYPAIMLRWEADYLTATGVRSTVTLPDGSTMMLDTASAVAVDFSDGRRQVRLLQGEAFFDVKPDPDNPFRVAGAYGEVEVRGTAFSVRMEPERDRVVLERGLVHVSRLTDRTDAADLEPDQMIVATAAALSGAMPADAATALAWRDGRIVFRDQPLSDVLDELRRYHSGVVIVADNRIGGLVVTGNYRLDDVEAAIRTLADAAGISMSRLPGGIIILR